MNQEVKFEELFLNIVSKYIKMLLKTFFYGRYIIRKGITTLHKYYIKYYNITNILLI